MTRDLHDDFVAAIAGGFSAPALLGEFEFDDGTVRMWTGYGVLNWNGNEYQGGGQLIGISAYEEMQALQAKGLTFQLDGVDPNKTQIALDQNYQGRPCRLYLALVHTDAQLLQTEEGDTLELEDGRPIELENTLINDPYLLFCGLMDVMECDDGADTSTIMLSAESIALLLKHTKTRYYTPEDQKAVYEGDTFLDGIAALQDKEIRWGPN